jgi:hypothetical protein
VSEERSSEGRSRVYTLVAGAVALAAWFAMLWFMFGEVL